jgi:hypothetical protein
MKDKKLKDELISFVPNVPLKAMMTERDRDGILVFLYKWINIHGLQQDHFTKEVVDKIKSAFNCDLDDYIRTVEGFVAKGYLDYQDDGDMFVTTIGFKKVTEAIEAYGDIPITFTKA